MPSTTSTVESQIIYTPTTSIAGDTSSIDGTTASITSNPFPSTSNHTSSSNPYRPSPYLAVNGRATEEWVLETKRETDEVKRKSYERYEERYKQFAAHEEYEAHIREFEERIDKWYTGSRGNALMFFEERVDRCESEGGLKLFEEGNGSRHICGDNVVLGEESISIACNLEQEEEDSECEYEHVEYASRWDGLEAYHGDDELSDGADLYYGEDEEEDQWDLYSDCGCDDDCPMCIRGEDFEDADPYHGEAADEQDFCLHAGRYCANNCATCAWYDNLERIKEGIDFHYQEEVKWDLRSDYSCDADASNREDDHWEVHPKEEQGADERYSNSTSVDLEGPNRRADFYYADEEEESESEVVWEKYYELGFARSDSKDGRYPVCLDYEGYLKATKPRLPFIDHWVTGLTEDAFMKRNVMEFHIAVKAQDIKMRNEMQAEEKGSKTWLNDLFAPSSSDGTFQAELAAQLEQRKQE